MKKNLPLAFVLFAAVAVIGTLGATPAHAADEAEPAGQTVFLEAKCNMCHGVPAAEIEAKTKSEKMRGPDLGGPMEAGAEAVAAYLRKEGELDGSSHKKKVDMSTEDVQTLLDWLAEMEPAAQDG